MSVKIAEVVICLPIYRVFDYLIPKDAPNNIENGQRVLVPFNRSEKQIIGFIYQIKTANSDTDLSKLKEIIDFPDSDNYLSSVLPLFQFAANYYFEPIGMVYKAAIPNLVRQKKELFPEKTNYYKINLAGKMALLEGKIKKNAVKQKSLLQILQQKTSQTTLKSQGFSTNDIKKLIQKEYIQQVEVSPYFSTKPIPKPEYSLTNQQKQVIEGISKKLNSFIAHLIIGVTGSGKTEVYIQLIEKVVQSGKQVLLLVPEIALTPQILNRFQDRFANRVAILHSDLSDTKRKNIWLAAASGDLPILIGTRLALFTPMKNLGLIIIDEEHDPSFKQHEGFSYHARDLSFVRAKYQNIPLVLGSATPSLEALYQESSQKLIAHELTEKANAKQAAKVELIDTRANYQLLSEKLIQEIHNTLRNGEQAILYLNKRGYSPVLLCSECDYSSECPFCSTHQNVHLQQQKLICHHCGYESKLPIRCPSCKNEKLQFVGAGTEKLEQEIIKQFPKHNILRVDRDLQTTSKQLNEALDQINRHEVDIILGTQLLIKGHHFSKVTLVGVIDSDQALYSSDFRAEERLLQQLIQVSGRSGRETENGRVFIQTALPEHPIFKSVLQSDYLDYAQTLLSERQQHHLPPYASMAMIQAKAKNKDYLKNYFSQFKKLLEDNNTDQIEILGPIIPPIEKRNDYYFLQLSLIAPQRKALQKYGKLSQSIITYLDKNNYYRTTFNIDPY